MNMREDFYQKRDCRSIEYGIDNTVFNQPVAIAVGSDVVSSERGQMALLSLVNMASRIHRKLQLSIPDGPVLASKSFYGVDSQRSLRDLIYTFAKAIDPFIEISWAISETSQAGIGLGQCSPPMPWYVGFNNGEVVVDKTPQYIDSREGFSFGACMGACLASSILTKQLLSMKISSTTISAWSLSESDNLDQGPEFFEPLDVGDVAIVGAGGVGSCFAYWLRQTGYLGTWTVIDGDTAEIHNTNRSLGILPIDAGWPQAQQKHKAQLMADLIQSRFQNNWYNDIVDQTVHYDLILPLANEYDVRACIAQRGEPILLHATTSENWEAQLHRHIPEKDDCIVCRMPKKGQLKCSAVNIDDNSKSSDAALPFLSATAGLLLLNGLYRLQYKECCGDVVNCWRVLFNSYQKTMKQSRFKCKIGCSVMHTRDIRQQLYGNKRWKNIN